MLVAVHSVFTINERCIVSKFWLRILSNKLKIMSLMEETASETESEPYSSENKADKIEVEAIDCVLDESACNARERSLEPYVDEPLADEDWLQKYRKVQEENKQLENEWKQCLENAEHVEDW